MSRAAYGNGAVYLRGRRWWISYSHRGRRFSESSGSGNRMDAVRLLRQRLAELGQGRAPIAEDRATFEALAQLLEQDYQINGRRSWDRANRALVHLRAAFAGTVAADFTPAAVTAYKSRRLQEGAAPATVQYEVSTLRRMCSLGVDQQLIAHRPAIRGLKVDNARQGFFTREHIEALLPQLPEALRPPVAFAFWTGWRIRSEVLTLRWSQVDLAAGEVRLEVGTTKNREARSFPFAPFPALDKLLHEQWAWAEALEARRHLPVVYVFHRNGKQIRDFRGAWEKACKAIGLEGLIPHDLRRSAVRNLVNAGIPQDTAMKLTGHKTAAVFRRYNIVTRSETEDAVAKLAGYLERKECDKSATIAPAVREAPLRKTR
jgi:integrase